MIARDVVEAGEYREHYYIIRKVSSWYTAYVMVSADVDGEVVDCHGGCTFTSPSWPCEKEPVGGGMHVIGWDYAHPGD